MASTQLYLVRHGETSWNAEGRFQGQMESTLTDLGVSQAKGRSAEMLALGFDAAYCSSSVRTRQTIEGLLSGQTTDVQYWDELREIMVGPWEGRLHKDIQAEQPQLYQQYKQQPELFKLEGAESFLQLQQRGEAALTRIAKAHAGQRVLVVSHGAIIKASLLRFLGWPLSQMWAEPPIGNCSCSVIEYQADKGFDVLSIADETEY